MVRVDTMEPPADLDYVDEGEPNDISTSARPPREREYDDICALELAE